MSGNPRKLLAIKKATDCYTRARGILLAELDRGAPRACLEAMVELCGLYVSCTGGTLVTQALDKELSEIAQRVRALPHLRAVGGSAESFEIEVDAACPQCGAPGRVSVDGDGQFACHCTGCFDGTEDAHLASQVVGRGKTARAAVDEWLEAAEGHVPQNVGYWPTSIEVLARAEFRRTEGWQKTETERGILFAPEVEAAE